MYDLIKAQLQDLYFNDPSYYGFNFYTLYKRV